MVNIMTTRSLISFPISCLTPRYAASPMCAREVTLADVLHKPILPIIMEMTPWPPPGAMAVIMSSIIYVDLCGMSTVRLIRQTLQSFGCRCGQSFGNRQNSRLRITISGNLRSGFTIYSRLCGRAGSGAEVSATARYILTHSGNTSTNHCPTKCNRDIDRHVFR